jgi:hypothetical protein
MFTFRDDRIIGFEKDSLVRDTRTDPDPLAVGDIICPFM